MQRIIPFDALLLKSQAAALAVKQCQCLSFIGGQTIDHSRTWMSFLYTEITMMGKRFCIHHQRLCLIVVVSPLVKNGKPMAVNISPIQNRDA